MAPPPVETTCPLPLAIVARVSRSILRNAILSEAIEYVLDRHTLRLDDYVVGVHERPA